MRRQISKLALLCATAGALAGCGPSPPPLPPGATGPEIVQGGAVFRYRNPDARTVYLVGDFNGWNATADPMNDENGDGEWTLFYPLDPGTYTYKFVIDGRRWIADPTNSRSVPDGFDGSNSVLKVPEGYKPEQ